MDLIPGKRYSFYMDEPEHKLLVTALFTGETEPNGNKIFMLDGDEYSIPEKSIMTANSQCGRKYKGKS